MEGHEDERLCGKWRVACGLYNYNLRDVFTWRLLKTLLMGQVCSLLICGTAVSCQYLADAKVETPMLQSFLNYAMLLLVYTTILCTRKGDRNILHILKTKWWKYLLMGVADVEANYTVVKAYQYTTLTSIQLLDCFVIPVLMVLSWFFLKTRFRPVHFVSVGVCLLGVGAMVGADILAGRNQGSTSSVVLGDGLVLLSAVLYAISNVCQEQTVKNLSRIEFLGMMGLFGTLISGVQLAVLETHAVAAITWDFHTSLWFAVYALCMYSLYSFMPVVVKMTSATAVNLSLLTADLFSLFCGLFLFHYSFSTLYIISFVVIMVGFVMFNAVPTYTALPGSGSNEEENPPEEESSSDRLLSAGPEAQREPERRDNKRGETQRPSETPTLETLCE
ncbi:hypothetical protein OYC64_020898 [Pagothenia borchgrevinki]|uniref:Solute carrier family 35 member F2 n=1 Tax=Pagothenia borchgrevinki TaxID=8213 RepID=A0ABD2FNQ1_PAGBO